MITSALIISIVLIMFICFSLYTIGRTYRTCSNNEYSHDTIEIIPMSGGGAQPKTKIIFIGVIPCEEKQIPKDASWYIYNNGDYVKYNNHYNAYGIREKRTLNGEFTFPFVKLYIEKLHPKTEAYFVIDKSLLRTHKIHHGYKSRVIYVDLSDFGRNMAVEHRKLFKDVDAIYINMRTLEHLLPEHEKNKHIIRDPVLKENIHTKSYEKEFVTMFGNLIGINRYVISDECSGLIPYRKLNQKRTNYSIKIDNDVVMMSVDFYEKPVDIVANGIPRRSYTFPKYINDLLIVSRLCYPRVYQKRRSFSFDFDPF